MKALQVLRRSVWILALSISTAGILAQTATDTFKPTVGQAGKDVVWVPSPQTLVDQMLDVVHPFSFTLHFSIQHSAFRII